MRVFPSQRTTAAVLVATAVLAFGGNAVAKDDDRESIEGAFNSTVTVKSCQNGAVLGSVRTLLLFHRGGTLTIDNNQGRLQRGLILGTWAREGGGRYSSEVSHFNYFEDGTLSGTNKITRTIVVGNDGNSFTAQMQVRVFGVDGTLLAQLCPTETGVRVTF